MQSKRTIKFTVRFTKEENEKFNKNVKTALVSNKADYLRRLAINKVILSKTDNDNFLEFLKVAGQQGKLIGLLRIFVMEYETNEKNEQRILSLIDELNQLKDKLKFLSDKIL